MHIKKQNDRNTKHKERKQIIKQKQRTRTPLKKIRGNVVIIVNIVQ